MNSLYQKIQKVETLQKSADNQTLKFKHLMKTDCIEHCSECCRYNEIEATTLEFMPLAWHAYKLGLIENWLKELENYDKSQCFFSIFENGKWGCKIYPVRGMICRLFGFSAILDKNNKPKWAVCKTLKKVCPDLITKYNEYIKKHNKIPIISEYYLKLENIDFYLSQERLPINIAIKNALEMVFNHFFYL